MNSYSYLQELSDKLFGSELVTALADTFKVLGDATRVRILDVLSRRELCVGDIAAVLGLSESAVSHQLRLLRNARLVRQRRAGQMMFYALDDHHVIRLFAQAHEHVQERKADIAAPADAHPTPSPAAPDAAASVDTGR
ncbi:MAG TPA: metalloregulator ArsR/SmtB family transcription factor [Aeromicrobium sp.]|nr:metalloregulator ArsR/SmtB family transcription factor [Aeromicrobium sp.]